MRCVQCEMPLSPSRTRCPRCGTPVAGKTENRSSGAGPVLSPPQPVPVDVDAVQPRLNAPVPTASWESPGSFASQMAYQNTAPAQDQLPFPGVNAPSSVQEIGQGGAVWPFSDPATPPSAQPDWGLTPQPLYNTPEPARPTPLSPLPLPSPGRRAGGFQWSTRLGLTLASICVITSGLLLIFVFVMTLGNPSLRANSTATSTTQPSPSVAVDPSPTLAPTPTPTTAAYPGAQFITDAQMASEVNGAVPTLVTTKFKPGQKMYVTFTMRTGGQTGAVCLLWYLNKAQFTQYQFPVAPADQLAYSFAVANAPGQGYVELYWASSVACTDKMLAQQVEFTVE